MRKSRRKNFTRFIKYFVLISIWYIWKALFDDIDFSKYDYFIKKPPIDEKQIWALYQGGYGNPEHNTTYLHWQKVENYFRDDMRYAPAEISSMMFPALGVYSSHDPSVIRRHFRIMRESGIDAVILLWSGVNRTDDTKEMPSDYLDQTMKLMFEIAPEYDMKIGILIQKYRERTNTTIKNDIETYLNLYGSSNSLLKIGDRPLIILYEPYEVENINHLVDSFHKSPNCFMVSTIIDSSDVGLMADMHFDAVFTYFASDNLNSASTFNNYRTMKVNADLRGIHFFPAVSPGYDDSRNVQWTNKMKRERDDGRYFERSFGAAITSGARVAIVNSFNVWEEGTEIEPVLPRPGYEATSATWKEGGFGSYYMEATKVWSDTFKKFSL